MLMLSTFFARFKVYAIAALGALVAGLTVVALIFRRGERAGRDEVIAEQKEKVDEIRQQHDEIDARRPDFDAAVGRLRDRSNRNEN